MMSKKIFDRSLLPEKPNLDYECKLWEQGIIWVAGIDEAGRGALAGPVSVGAVILDPNSPHVLDQLIGVEDSKVMTPKDREIWAAIIKNIALDWGVGMTSPHEIDRFGIVQGTHLAARRALAGMEIEPQHLLVDYLCLTGVESPQTSLIKGDARSLSIAAAAILAKTSRDMLMVELDRAFPGYGFARNKGYGTSTHREAIAELGPCSQHRRTFSPISEYNGLFPPIQKLIKNKKCHPEH